MKTKLIIPLVVLNLLTITHSFGQKTKRSIPPKDCRQIIWKDGGDSFAVFENGDVFLFDSKRKTYIKVYRKKRIAKSVFKLVDESNFLETNSNIKTEGLYEKTWRERDFEYLEYINEDNLKHIVYWRKNDSIEDEAILNTILMKLYDLY